MPSRPVEQRVAPSGEYCHLVPSVVITGSVASGVLLVFMLAVSKQFLDFKLALKMVVVGDRSVKGCVQLFTNLTEARRAGEQG